MRKSTNPQKESLSIYLDSEDAAKLRLAAKEHVRTLTGEIAVAIKRYLASLKQEAQAEANKNAG